MSFKEDYILVEETKNGETRKVPMNNHLSETLKKIIIGNSESPYLFPKDDGSSFGNVRKSFDRAVKQAGLDGLRFHDLRHTFASRLVMGGVDLVTVMELLGHKDLKMTRRYSHPATEHKRAAVKILDGVTTILTTSPKRRRGKIPENP